MGPIIGKPTSLAYGMTATLWAVPTALLFVLLARQTGDLARVLRDRRTLGWLALSAGVIAITTKRGTAEPQRSVAVEYGSLGWKKGKASFQQANAVGDGKLNTALYLSKTDSKGLNHYEGFKDEAVQASVDYTSKQFDAGVALWHAKNRFNYAQLKEVTSSPSGPTYWGTQLPDPNAYNARETNTFSAYLNHGISD